MWRLVIRRIATSILFSVLPRAAALVPLLLIHTLRTLGLTVIVPAVTDPNLPRSFSVPLAYGDLIAATLAFFAIAALRLRWPFAIGLVWLFNLEGTLDLLNAVAQGIAANATQYQLGAAWFIPTYAVPLLWVSHALIFIVLLRRDPVATSAAMARAA